MSRAIGGKGDPYPAVGAVRLHTGHTSPFALAYACMPTVTFLPFSVAPKDSQRVWVDEIRHPPVSDVPWSRAL